MLFVICFICYFLKLCLFKRVEKQERASDLPKRGHQNIRKILLRSNHSSVRLYSCSNCNGTTVN